MILKQIVLILITIPATGSAQWIGDIKTESDWEDFFINGYIDYNSYQLLREIAEGAVIEDTLDFISSTLGVSAVELLEDYDISGTPRFDYGNSSLQKSTIPWSGRLRLGSKIENESSEGFLTASARSSKTNVHMKFRNNANGKLTTERRSLEFKDEDFTITLGNFANNVGCGLGIGRLDYRPVSLDSEAGELEQLIFPDNSYYNGVKAEVLGNYTVVYSVKKYNNVYKNTWGVSMSTNLNHSRLGIAGSATRLSSGSKSKTLGAGSVFIDLYDYGTRAEAAYGESGPGACIQFSKRGYLLRGWYYDDAHINLQSSGFAHPDYLSYTDDFSEISFRQAQRGEAGFYARKRLRVKTLEFRGATEFWKNPRNDLINYNNYIQSRLSISRDIMTLVGYIFNDRNGLTQNKIESGFKITREFEIDVRVLTAFENGSFASIGSRFYILGSIPLTARVSVAGRLRWRFDGEFDYFIEERAALNDRFYLKATYRWKEDSRKELGSLYAFLENRF